MAADPFCRPAREASRPRRPCLLLYAMYDTAGVDSGPKVRIEMMRRALGEQLDLEVVEGDRTGRPGASLRWLAGGAWRRVDAVYVESPSSSPTPLDFLFLVLLRLLRRPIGVYFRDAYQLFRDEYPLTRRRQHLADLAWRITTPLLGRLATVRFAPSAGIARVLEMPDAVLLPPGTDPALPNLGPAAGEGQPPLVAYVGALGRTDGFDLLLAAMAIVRRQVPAARLRVVGPEATASRRASLPDWLDLRRAGRAELPALLADARVLVIPRLITPYTNLAVPIKLMDYLAFGKPIVATAAAETRAILEPAGAGLVCADRPEELAAALLRVIGDDDLAAGLGRRARELAVAGGCTWGDRARRLIEVLLDQRP